MLRYIYFIDRSKSALQRKGSNNMYLLAIVHSLPWSLSGSYLEAHVLCSPRKIWSHDQEFQMEFAEQESGRLQRLQWKQIMKDEVKHQAIILKSHFWKMILLLVNQEVGKLPKEFLKRPPPQRGHIVTFYPICAQDSEENLPEVMLYYYTCAHELKEAIHAEDSNFKRPSLDPQMCKNLIDSSCLGQGCLVCNIKKLLLASKLMCKNIIKYKVRKTKFWWV